MSPHGLSMACPTNKPQDASAILSRRPTPRAGDVLAAGRRARADIYTISVVPAEAHTIVARYREAIEKVRELARGLSVDGWYTSDQTHYARVASYRSRAEVNSSASAYFRTNDEVSG
jgi:hypothetical protein